MMFAVIDGMKYNRPKLKTTFFAPINCKNHVSDV